MEIEIGPYDGDARAFFEAGEVAFGERLRDDDLALWEATFEPDRAVVARDGSRIVGTAGIFSFELTVPGGVLPAAGVTAVGVQPTHRRRGILRGMMRAQLDAIHDRGEPIAILWASEGQIYQRFGYGLSTVATRISVARDRSAFRSPHHAAGTIRLADVDEAKRLLPPIHDAVRPHRPGFFNRTPAYWDSEVFYDPEHRRHGASAAWYAVHEAGGEPDGFARYRIRDRWDDAGPNSTLVVTDLVAVNPAAHLDLWRFLLDVDLMGRIEAWNVAPDDPLILAVAEPRRLGVALGDGMWLRVVDVSSALAGRRYRADGSLVLEVADELCPWNDGRWALRVEDGIPFVEPTTDAPDVACDTTDLAAAYLGAFTYAALADAARVSELAPGGVTRADALFRTDRAPWCPRVF